MKSFKSSFLIIVTLVFISFTAMSQNYSAVVLSGKYWGIVDQNGTTILDHQHYLIEPKIQYAGKMLAKNRDKDLGFISSNGTFTPCNCDQLSRFSDGFAPFRIKQFWGYLNAEGKQVIPAKFEDVKSFRGEKAWVKIDNKWFQIDASGKRLFDNSFERFSYFKNGYARVRKGDLWGFITPNGELVNGGVKYTDNEDFYDGFAFVKQGDNWGVINTNGEFVIDAKYSKATGFLKNGLATVVENEKVGLVNNEGKQVVAAEYQRIKLINKNYAAIFNDGLWGFVDRTGKVVAKPQFRKWLPGTEDVIQVLKGEQWGYLSLASGEVKLLGKYQAIKKFHNRMALVKKIDKWGYINENFEEVISPRFIRAFPFYGELAVAKENSLYGYINKTGEFVIKEKFESADPFVESLTRNKNYDCTAQYKEQKLYNKIGFGSAIVLSADESKEIPTARVKFNGRWAFINNKGEVLSEGFENAEKFVNGFSRVRKKGLWGFVDYSGKIVVEPKFKLAFEMTELCD